jgi:hypothetical protein
MEPFPDVKCVRPLFFSCAYFPLRRCRRRTSEVGYCQSSSRSDLLFSSYSCSVSSCWALRSSNSFSFSAIVLCRCLVASIFRELSVAVLVLELSAGLAASPDRPLESPSSAATLIIRSTSSRSQRIAWSRHLAPGKSIWPCLGRK